MSDSPQIFIAFCHDDSAGLNGRTVRDLIASEAPLNAERAVSIISSVCDALDAAHQRDVVHRDLKPQWIHLLDNQPAPEQSFQHERAEVRGTPGYMSPEQIQGDSAIDARADVYSTAVVLYELLTGRPPYRGATQAEVMTAQVEDPPPSIRACYPDLKSDIPQALDRLIQRALSPYPGDRPPSSGEFKALMWEAMAEFDKSVESAKERAVKARVKRYGDTVRRLVKEPPLDDSTATATPPVAARPGPKPRRANLKLAASMALFMGVVGLALFLLF